MNQNVTGNIRLMVSRIKNPLTRRLTIVASLPILVAASLVFNVVGIAVVTVCFVSRIAWACVTLEITGIPKLIETAREVW